MFTFKNLKTSQKFNLIFFIAVVLTSILTVYFNKLFSDYPYFYTIFPLILILFLYFSLQKIIVLPLVQLASSIDKFNEKNLEIKIEIKGNNEIEKLSREFNFLADLIKKNKKNLDEIVRNRTIELELACEELKKSIIKYERKESFLENLFDSIPFPIFYKNRHFRYIRCNTAFEKFVGRTKKDIYGKTVYDLASPRLAEIYHKQDVELIESQGIQQYDSIVEDSRGNSKNVIFNKSICKYGEKNIGIVGIITDISNKKDN